MTDIDYWLLGGLAAFGLAWLWESVQAAKYRRLYFDQLEAAAHLESRLKVYDDNRTVMKWRGKILAWHDDVDATSVFDRLVWLAGQDVESDSYDKVATGDCQDS